MSDPPPPAAPAPPPGPVLPPGADFLPPAFHAARRSAKVRAWRLAAAGVAAGLLGAGLLGGVWRTARLRDHRDRVVAEADALKALDVQADALRAELAVVRDDAAVLAGLHLRSPASRLLADLAGAAPAGVTFTELTLVRNPAPRAEDEDPAAVSPSAADARDLARRRRGEHAELHVDGTAPTDAAVAGLLSRAAAGGDFDAVELLFTDRADESAAAARTFSARLTARPAAAAD